MHSHQTKTFEKVVYTGRIINGREFEECVFKQCDLSDSDFSNTKFIDCRFEGCNLSLLKLKHTTLNNITFEGCKVMGVNFHECSDFLFSVTFHNCILDYASFIGKKLPKTSFAACSLKNVNFERAVLAGSRFDDCNLEGAVFDNTDLASANFSTAYNYVIDPEKNKVRKAVFAAHGLAGLLGKYQIKIV